MIFPLLRGLVHWKDAPVTYLLVGVNLLVFFVTFDAFFSADRSMDVILEDEAFMSTQGAAFATMIEREPDRFTRTLRVLAGEALEGGSEARRVLGSLALRNRDFMSRAETYDFGGDEIAIDEWRMKLGRLERIQSEHPSFQWGVSSRTDTWVHWLSYQFAHSGWTHLFWNMLFLLIFGSFVELSFGGSVVLVTYLLGGVLGAWAFSLLSGVSSSPLVGASAAVSGLMGLVQVVFWRQRLRFFYWLLPIKGYYGFALLPAWLVFVVFVLPDLSGFLAAVPEFGSIAYSAHLGGMLAGVAIALLVLAALRTRYDVLAERAPVREDRSKVA